MFSKLSLQNLYRNFHMSCLSKNKYLTRLKLKEEQARNLFVKKRGHAMLLEGVDPKTLISLTKASKCVKLENQPNTVSSLKASSRVMFAVGLAVKEIIHNILERENSFIEITEITQENDFKELCLCCKPFQDINIGTKKQIEHLSKIKAAIRREFVMEGLSANPPKVTFKEKSLGFSNAESVNNIFKNCDMENSCDDDVQTPLIKPKWNESLRSRINQDFSCFDINGDTQQEGHIFGVSSVTGNHEAEVYGLDRKNMLAKISKKHA